jgi:hypothetical protein
MPNFCPSCGAKVDEGYKFCLSCGAKLQSEDTLDSKTSNENNTQEHGQQFPPAQQGYTPPTGQKKLNKNLLIVLIAIIVVIVVVIMLTGGGIDSRFVGEWEQTGGGLMTIDWTFNNDGSLEIMGMDLAKWSVNGNKLCFETTNDFWDDYMMEGSFDEVCYDFEFSDGGNTVYLSIDGSENLVLTKK